MDEVVSNESMGEAAPAGNNGIPGALPGETQTQTAQRLYKVTVDGAEQEVDEETLLKGYTHGAAANKRMQDASNIRKEAEDVLKFFKSNPREAFSRLGMDAKQFAEQLIQDELEEALMDPKDKDLRDYKKKVDSYESERRVAQEEYEREQMDAEVARQTTAIQTEIMSSLDTAGLPKTERTVGRIVYYMQSAMAEGYNVTPKDVIDQVRQDYIHDFKQFMGSMSEDQIEMFLGADVVKKVAKSTLKTERREQVVPKSVNENREPKKKEAIRSPRDFFKPR